jgi:type II secretory pathway pseudopilin PulG
MHSTHQRFRTLGFGLLELVIATAIFGIALVVLASSIGRCVRALTSADNLQWATDLAEQQIEVWKAESSLEDEIKPGSKNGSQTFRNRIFDWEQQIEDVPTEKDETFTEKSKLIRYTLRLKWKDVNTEKERTFVTLASKHPKLQKNRGGGEL